MFFKCGSGKKLYPLGTGTSFDVKDVYSNYENLTVDDFIVEVYQCGAGIGRVPVAI